ncbi:MAG: DUF502 domain-containing protein [Balneolaceae bacterium]
MKNILQYFLRGMLVVLPLTATFYLIYGILKWINNIFNNFFYSWFDYEIPGLGIITGFAVISFIGFLVSRAFAKPIVHIFEKLIIRTPLVNIVYSSLKDLTEALVGEKKKFNKPVYVEFGVPGIKRFGFITEESLLHLGLSEDVAVYCPHSYNFSGNLYIVPKNKVTPIKTDATNFMRFIVSGGVTKTQE